jgi:hypothetical protein
MCQKKFSPDSSFIFSEKKNATKIEIAAQFFEPVEMNKNKTKRWVTSSCRETE